MAFITENNFIYYGKQCLSTDIEIPDAPDQFHDWNGTEWVLNTERKLLADRNAAKAARSQAVENIKVTTSSNKVFDGDEISQTRMTRAIIAMQATATPDVSWVLADNTVTTATLQELTEALALSGAEQARLWVL